ncbi:TIGR00266 family protein [Pseudoramibacter sp.]|jgi:uncharacterized protein (TIGR00266 family)|uniref:TIGR00266 family protein n=1 Tax=Pseudoramibacter sp. TaxID=2034862 RepID=UPI0025D02F75|nr:TIGR00266 family protein [Pseudoramibacter sp.]MCH4073046.1 TIGR00266 family protein [Pseudoramibacter sp.]MCH4106817.1 TIGR00266 family protein [Pseudoramibacter sp.]
MEYKILGDNLPVAVCRLNTGETVKCESGSMSWMDGTIEMATKGGGFGKMLKRSISGDSAFINYYTAAAPGEIAFASSFPGAIKAIKIESGREIIAQKSAYLASEEGVEMDIFFQKKLGAGFFGGEGFIMQQYSGQGIVFLEIDGSAVTYELEAGQRKIVDTGYLVAMDASVSMDIERVKGVKNVLLGGEGLFNTVLTGPGRIVLQTMPIAKTAALMKMYLSDKK